ncbi:uncharacterized protein BN458_00348 [Prevotella sp. CAG:1058]|nr:uncharacterized protein BN458_00348 [Prevotella sp. CAG:1058]
MIFHYASEKNVQIVLALLKANGIKTVIASPGATNESIVASMQYDHFFEMYSCVDERSAAYMACGMAVESGRPVVLSCTGATSSRNYLPGLTEAYYRHLPILVITSSMDINKVGHLYPQCTNRMTPPADTVNSSYLIETIKDDDDEWDCTLKINRAISDLSFNGGGPVHINLITRGCNDYSISKLPEVKSIERITTLDEFPLLEGKKVLVFIGSHKKWSIDEETSLDIFCEKYNTVALCDHTSNYKGRFRVLSSLLASQEVHVDDGLFTCDILIHLGEISGDYYTMGAIRPQEVWRIDEDGKIKDKFKKLTKVFVLQEKDFFKKYNEDFRCNDGTNPLSAFQQLSESIIKRMPELPFSNIWIASKLCSLLPVGAVLHLGILNSLRAWNFFEIDRSILSYCNVGGFGIDGILSTAIGASLVNPSKLYYVVLGDLAFFYDINSLGNRNIGNNLRILVVNNGRGVEFHTYKHSASKFGNDTDNFIAAAWHNGNQSHTLVKSIAASLGFVYLSASDKNDFDEVYKEFISPTIEKSIIFEVFTQKVDEADVLRQMRTINGKSHELNGHFKQMVKNVLGNSGLRTLKKIVKK